MNNKKLPNHKLTHSNRHGNLYRALILIASFLAIKINLLGSPDGSKGTPIDVPVGKIEVHKDGIISEGLITPITSYSALTSYHLLKDYVRAEVTIEGQKREVAWVKEKRNREKAQDIQILYTDICEVGWKDALDIPSSRYPTLSQGAPSPDEVVWVPKKIGEDISWEKRYIVGLEDYAVWINLPQPAYSWILYLNGRPSNEGSLFKSGDSGGGWINENNELIAITSRISEKRFGPTKQIVYGTLSNPNPAPKKTGDRNSPAPIPLLISLAAISLIIAIVYTIKKLARN